MSSERIEELRQVHKTRSAGRLGDAAIDELFAHIDTLEAQAKRLADQALVVMQLDLGYSEERPCRHGWHPIRHQLLWEDALNITPLPKVDRAINGALFNEPITEALEKQKEQAKLDVEVDADKWIIVSLKHGYVGNDILIYRPESKGYTLDVAHAGKFSFEEAKSIRDGCHGDLCIIPFVVAMNASIAALQLSKYQLLELEDKALDARRAAMGGGGR